MKDDDPERLEGEGADPNKSCIEEAIRDSGARSKAWSGMAIWGCSSKPEPGNICAMPVTRLSTSRRSSSVTAGRAWAFAEKATAFHASFFNLLRS